MSKTMKKNFDTMSKVGLYAILVCLCAEAFAQKDRFEMGYRTQLGVAITLQNLSNDKVVEVEDGLLSKGVKVQQYRGYTTNGSADGYGQQWVFLPAGSIQKNGQSVQLVRILNYGFMNYLTNENGVPKLAKPRVNGTNLGQFWEVMKTSEPDVVRIRSHLGNQFLQAPNNSSDGEGMLLVEGSDNPLQKFKKIKHGGMGAVPYYFLNVPVVLKPANNETLALDVTNCGTATNTLLNVWTEGSNNTCQQFVIKNDRTTELTKIIPVISPTMSVRLQEVGSTSPGANIVIGDDPVPYSTLWIVLRVAREPNAYVLINAISGLCMETWNKRTDKGATIGQNLFSNESHQKWIIRKVN